jgi:hypothetical protein
MAYRLYRRDPVVQGEWYYALVCHGCKKLIYMLDDNSKGKRPVQFVGAAQLSVPCSRCMHDDLYSSDDLLSVQATETLPAAYPERVNPSKSSRKPINKTYPNAKVTMGVGYIEDRPKAAALVGRIITSWADIEVQSARLLAELMGTNIPAAAAVFGSLRSSRAQHDALCAAAETVLDEKDLLLFNAHIARKASLEKERNDLAHGCFGVSVGIPDYIVWVAQSDYLAFTAAHKANDKALDLRQKQFVYELGTLERIAQEIAEFYDQLGFFIGYLVARHDGPNGEAFRASRYPELCNQPHIRQALDNIQNAERSSKDLKK